MTFMLNLAPGRISFTSNSWTSITTDGHMCLTAHFIDKNWVLHKRVFNFCFMPPPYNDISLSNKIEKVIYEWGIENRVFSVPLENADNASSNDVSVDRLRTFFNIKKALVCVGEFFYLRCWAHVLNLLVQDGLREIDIVVQKIHESVKCMFG